MEGALMGGCEEAWGGMIFSRVGLEDNLGLSLSGLGGGRCSWFICGDSSFGGSSRTIFGCRNKRRLSKLRSRTAASASVALVAVSRSRPREYRPVCRGASFLANDSSVGDFGNRALNNAIKEDVDTRFGGGGGWFVREDGGFCCWSSGVGGTTLARETNAALEGH